MSKTILCLTFLGLIQWALAQQNKDFLDYIDRYKRLAVKEMDRAGVPASIKLAQALLESNAGRSTLARKANNHFGIKCGPDWKGKTYHQEDDDYDAFGNLIKSCFRHYKSAEESFIAHSEFLRDPRRANRYAFLFRLDPLDYKRWAVGLRTSGYATSATYDQKLIRIIETYQLHELDRLAGKNFPGERPRRMRETIAGLDVQIINDVKVVLASKPITLDEISVKTRIPLVRLERYNERLPAAPTDTLQPGTKVYIQPKRLRFRGRRKWHYVHEGETIYEISQNYGIRASRLRKRNRIPEGLEVQQNERLKLRGWKIRENERPRLISEQQPTAIVPVLRSPDEGFMEEIAPPRPTPTQPVPGTPQNPQPSQPGTQPTRPATPGSTSAPTGPQPSTPQNTGVQPAPPATTPANPSTSPSGPDTQPTASTHTVVKGDTLFSIARRYNTTVSEIIRLNNLPDTNIRPGQVLRIR